MTFRRKFRILTAKSGAEALEILAEEPVGVVLTDQRMPEMSGVDLIKAARERHPENVYLILTGYSDFDAMVEGINTGVLSGYIQKPWEPEEMEVVLRNAIERRLLAGKLRSKNEQLNALNRDLEEKVQGRTAEIERAMAELRTINAQLAELNRIKNDLVAFCSHDLNSPLTAMIGFIDLLEMRADKIENFDVIAPTLDGMRTVAEEMSSLVHHILDLSKLDSGREELRTRDCTLREVALRSVELMRPLAEQKHIDMRLECDGEMMPITFDVERISQVASNLISNAIKFTHPGGDVSVHVCHEDGGAQRMQVRDRGIGMTPEVSAKIFDVPHEHRRRGTEGEASNGLGLMICKRVVEMHGGEVWVESVPGKGSVFAFRLPPEPRRAERGGHRAIATPAER
jgi:signal transduction histidine kinase